VREIIERAVRCPDPFHHVEAEWIIRRLAPRCSPIELSQLPNKISQADLLEAMGSEIANIHLGTHRVSKAILADLKKRKSGWMEAAAREMSKALENDWKEWRAGG
jgi:hypothetical protein